jgi:hypothetical protein
MLYEYWGYIGSLSDIEEYIRVFENDQWNCEPIPFQADIYGLVSGRHIMPVKNFIFDQIPFGNNSYSQMEKMAIDKLKQKTCDNLVLFVTGYTPAVIAAINAAKSIGYSKICLKHYDKDTGIYLCQWVY